VQALRLQYQGIEVDGPAVSSSYTNTPVDSPVDNDDDAAPAYSSEYNEASDVLRLALQQATSSVYSSEYYRFPENLPLVVAGVNRPLLSRLAAFPSRVVIAPQSRRQRSNTAEYFESADWSLSIPPSSPYPIPSRMLPLDVDRRSGPRREARRASSPPARICTRNPQQSEAKKTPADGAFHVQATALSTPTRHLNFYIEP
jgi:hypothetical protein